MALKNYIAGDVSTPKPPGEDNAFANIGPGPYVGVVKVNRDPTRMGRLAVNIPALSGTENPSQKQLITCDYLSPFYGVKTEKYVDATDPNNYKSGQHSYGMWFVPPDIDTKVLVIFAEGKSEQAYWIGCVIDPFLNQMTPGIGASSRAGLEAEGDTVGSKEARYGTNEVPTGNVNRLAATGVGVSEDDPNVKLPIHPFADDLKNQGLITDQVRGTTTSSARRESPSSVFGISTPGRRDQSSPDRLVGPRDSVRKEKVNRLTGHTFVLDDGDSEGTNQLIRLRSASGHQILLHDTEGVVYIANGSGNAWMEFDRSGSIDIYSGGTVSMRSKGDMNFHSDADINMFAGNRIRMRSLNKLAIDGGSIVQHSDTDIQQQATTGSITSKAPAGSILSYAQQSQIHQSSGVHHLTGSQVHFNSISTRADFFGPDMQRTDTLSNIGTPTLHSFNQDVDVKKKSEDRPLAVNQQGMITMSGMRTPTHEPWTHWNETKYAIGSAPSKNTRIPGTPEFLAQRNRNSDKQVIRDAQFQADLEFEIKQRQNEHKGDVAKIRAIADRLTKDYNKLYAVSDSVPLSELSVRNDIINQTVESVTGSQINLLKDQVFVNKSGVLYTAGNLSQSVTGTTKGVLNDLSKGVGVFTTAANVLSDTGTKVQGIVPGLGNVGTALNTVNTVTNTYKNIVAGNVVGVTQIKSVVSTVGSTVAKVARSVGKIFGF